MIKVGNYSYPKLIFLLDKLLLPVGQWEKLVIIGNYCSSKHRRCNYHYVVCKNILLQLFCLKSLFEWKYVVPLHPINKNSSASDPDKKLEIFMINFLDSFFLLVYQRSQKRDGSGMVSASLALSYCFFVLLLPIIFMGADLVGIDCTESFCLFLWGIIFLVIISFYNNRIKKLKKEKKLPMSFKMFFLFFVCLHIVIMLILSLGKKYIIDYYGLEGILTRLFWCNFWSVLCLIGHALLTYEHMSCFSVCGAVLLCVMQHRLYLYSLLSFCIYGISCIFLVIILANVCIFAPIILEAS